MLKIDCSVGEGGGGLVRASLPLAVLTGQPVELVNIRSRRDPATRGIGWTHFAFIEAICAWTGSRAEFSGLGATRLIFTPGPGRTAGQLSIDLDDSDKTFTTDHVHVTRNYIDGSDHFLENIDNRNGRGIRGHSIAMFLVGLLPLLATADGATTIRALGSTETPGGPFIDAIKHCLYPPASKLVGRVLQCDVKSRGCLGVGGGEVLATIQPDQQAMPPNTLTLEDGQSLVEAIYYLFGGSRFSASASSQLLQGHQQIEATLMTSIEADMIFIPYSVRRVQVIFLIKTHQSVRDVSVCWEEGWGLGAAFVEACTLRLVNEMEAAGLTSRFVVEQLLPLAAATNSLHRFRTEALTNHAISVIHVIKALTTRRITALSEGRAVAITVEPSSS